MAKLLRVALVGGSEIIRATRRAALEAQSENQVVLDTDGFELTPEKMLGYDFDVAVIESRLPNFAAEDFVRALHALAKINSVKVGRVIITSMFEDASLRLVSIEAGAVDCVFLEQGIEHFLETVKRCEDIDADFGVREILENVEEGSITGEEFQKASIALDSLDEKEAAIVKQFCQLKTDAQIAQAVQVPKLKVRNTIEKVENLLLLSTRSQLLLKLRRLGALAL